MISRRASSAECLPAPPRARTVSLEVAGAASRWATPRAATAPPAPTPMTNEMSTMLDGQELAVGDEIEALGSAPGGNGRVWFRRRDIDHRPSAPQVLTRQLMCLGRQSLSCLVLGVERGGRLVKWIGFGLHSACPSWKGGLGPQIWFSVL